MENIVQKGQGHIVNRLSNRRKGDDYYHNSRISYKGILFGFRTKAQIMHSNKIANVFMSKVCPVK